KVVPVQIWPSQAMKGSLLEHIGQARRGARSFGQPLRNVSTHTTYDRLNLAERFSDCDINCFGEAIRRRCASSPKSCSAYQKHGHVIPVGSRGNSAIGCDDGSSRNGLTDFVSDANRLFTHI